jgi:maleate isomerase
MTRLGMLTPSSNTVLEPATVAMLAGLPDVSVHFSRFTVTEIALTQQSLGQFDLSGILRAADLLAHARVATIAWNGTSASWLGYDSDERLCAEIQSATGTPACTSILAFREIFRRTGLRRLGLVTPYIDEVQRRIIANWTADGITVTAERHSGLQDNFAFSEVPESEVAEMIRAVAREGCDAVAVLCTNMRGAALAECLEQELGVPIYDSVATSLWTALRTAGVDPTRIKGWGALFRDPALSAL